MPLRKLFCSLGMALLGFGAGTALAHDAVLLHGQPQAKTQGNEVHEIKKALKSLFDKPEAPLTVNPVSIEGDFAVAGWMQDRRGGRALLHREQGHWRIALCGGDGLIQAEVLAQSGLKPAAAKRLARTIRTAESRLPADQREKLSTFDGIVKVGVGHDGHHGAEPAAKH